MPLQQAMLFIMIHGGNMIDVIHLVANVLLLMIGIIFAAWGSNWNSRMLGLAATIMGVLQLLVNIGLLK